MAEQFRILVGCECIFFIYFLFNAGFCCLRESDITKERIQKILASGANVILTTGGVDDMCLKYFVDVGAMAVRRVLKRDLKRIAKATGGMLMFVAAEFVFYGVFFFMCSWWNRITREINFVFADLQQPSAPL